MALQRVQCIHCQTPMREINAPVQVCYRCRQGGKKTGLCGHRGCNREALPQADAWGLCEKHYTITTKTFYGASGLYSYPTKKKKTTA